MIVMIVGMVRALRDERFAPLPGRKQRQPAEPWTGRDCGVCAPAGPPEAARA